MECSTFHIMSQPEGISDQQVLADTLAEIDAAEALGFTNIWLTEHHGSRYGLGVAPAVLAAAVAQRTARVGIGFAVHVSALHHPLRLAEEIAMVDHLSQGRVVAGFGSGYSPHEYRIYGVDFNQRRARHKEVLEIVRRAWQEDGFDYTGQYYRLEQARLALKPYQQPHPPIALTAASTAAFEAAGREGWKLLVLGGNEQIQAAVDSYQQGALATGAAGQGVGALRHIFVCEEAAAVEALKKPTCWHLRLVKYLADPAGQVQEPTAQEVEDYIRQRVIAGPADRVVVALEELAEMGVSEVLCWMKWGDMTHGQAMASMRLLAERVMPRLGQ